MRLSVWLLLWVISFSACQLTEQQLRINNQSIVLYKGGITKAEAKRLGNFLLQQGYFNTFDERKVRVQRRGHTYTITFIIDNHTFKEDKENVVAGFRVWQSWLQELVFPSTTVVLKLADSHWQVLSVIDSSTLTSL